METTDSGQVSRDLADPACSGGREPHPRPPAQTHPARGRTSKNTTESTRTTPAPVVGCAATREGQARPRRGVFCWGEICAVSPTSGEEAHQGSRRGKKEVVGAPCCLRPARGSEGEECRGVGGWDGGGGRPVSHRSDPRDALPKFRPVIHVSSGKLITQGIKNAAPSLALQAPQQNSLQQPWLNSTFHIRKK